MMYTRLFSKIHKADETIKADLLLGKRVTGRADPSAVNLIVCHQVMTIMPRPSASHIDWSKSITDTKCMDILRFALNPQLMG